MAIDKTTIDPNEVEKFSSMAYAWWDESGKFRPLHQINPLRIAYIKSKVIQHFKLNEQQDKVFSGLKLIDIGCGGGLLSEPMCRLGAKVTAIDAAEKNIKIASLHSQKMSLDIDYQATSIEEMAKTGAQYDIVLNMEVIEHVANVNVFMHACAKVLKPGGIMFIATLNRTIKSYLLAIVGAEYILNWLPRGTHSWEKFLRPSEIASMLRQNDLQLKELKGMEYSLLKGHWYLTDNIDVNYLMEVSKEL
jgi:2-polyprenyl-6-hydroxyphenyl methylase/3-demethylubiquinone-9 3-methyltransferase